MAESAGDVGFRPTDSARSFSQQIAQWAELTRRKKRRVAAEATAEVFRLALRTQDSVTVSGTYSVGYVPVLTGQLVDSAEVTVDGQLVGTGEMAWQGVPDAMNLGAVAYINFSAPYARHVEYGTRHMGGRFFVLSASQQWFSVVQEIVNEVRAQPGFTPAAPRRS